jgi:predicted DNA-binding protein (UPF0251 family)
MMSLKDIPGTQVSLWSGIDDVCKRDNIECAVAMECEELCGAANEWADQDYVSMGEMLVDNDILPLMANNALHNLPGAVACGITDEIPLEVLTDRQLEVIRLMYFLGDSKLSFGDAAEALDVYKNAVYCVHEDAAKRLGGRIVAGRTNTGDWISVQSTNGEWSD